MSIKKIGLSFISQGKPVFSGEGSFLRLLEYIGRLLIFIGLYTASWMYRGVVQLRLMLYRFRLLKRTMLACPVISIGNITTGGTGKTPMVILIAQILQKHGKRVAVLSRGYHRKEKSEGPVIVPVGGEDVAVEAVGDEPLLIARKIAFSGKSDISSGTVIVGRKRALSGRLALEQLQTDILLLDDGFQHVQLARTCDIVLIDATNPFGGGYMLPAGFLREPLHNLQRAHAFVITRSDEVEDIEPIRRQLQRFNPAAPVFTARHIFDHIHDALTQEPVKATDLATHRLLAVSGLANPASFHRLLHSLKLPVLDALDFPDHHWFSEQDIDQIRRNIVSQHFDAVVTTEKDEVRLCTLAEQVGVPIYTVAITLHVDPARQFETLLRSATE